MGLRFRKSIKIAPGVKVNINKKSVGVTMGGKGFHHTVNTSGRKTTSVGIPGTGLSYSSTSQSKKNKTNVTSQKTQESEPIIHENTTIKNTAMKQPAVPPRKKGKTLKIWGIILICASIVGMISFIIEGDLYNGFIGGGILLIIGILLFINGKKKLEAEEQSPQPQHHNLKKMENVEQTQQNQTTREQQKSSIMNFEIAKQIFSEVGGGIGPSKGKLLQQTVDLLQSGKTRIELLAIAADMCKPADTVEKLYYISKIYVYAGAKYRKEAIEYLSKFIDRIDEYHGFPNGTIRDYDGFIIDQRKANIASIYSDLGKCYEGEYMFENALKAYEKEYELTPYYPTGIINISNILIKQNNLESALKVLLEAKTSEFYKKSFKEILDKKISDVEAKISKGYVYKPRNQSK